MIMLLNCYLCQHSFCNYSYRRLLDFRQNANLRCFHIGSVFPTQKPHPCFMLWYCIVCTAAPAGQQLFYLCKLPSCSNFGKPTNFRASIDFHQSCLQQLKNTILLHFSSKIVVLIILLACVTWVSSIILRNSLQKTQKLYNIIIVFSVLISGRWFY